MPGEIQTSFIPKAPITATARPAQSSSVGFMTVISLILVLSSMAVFAGALAYQQFLHQEVNNIKDRIVSLKQEMPVANLQEIERLHAMITNADSLLGRHVSSNRIFTLLQDTTIPAVRYTNFSFNGTEVKIKGTARTYEDIAAQARVFVDLKEAIKEAVFSDFTVDKNTNLINFSLALTIAPSAFSYDGNFAESTALPLPETVTGQATSSTP